MTRVLRLLSAAVLLLIGCQAVLAPLFSRSAAATLQTVAQEETSDRVLKKWIEQDVAYLISEAEKLAFQRLAGDAARYQFIERFWEQRDPTPGTSQNEFRDEHYRRVAYANERFRNAEAGWRTDRGRTYITWGPPDQIESHPSGDGLSGPFEIWRYRAGSDPNAAWERSVEFAGHDYRLRQK